MIVCVVTFVIIIVNNDIISLCIVKQVVMINMSKQFKSLAGLPQIDCELLA